MILAMVLLSNLEPIHLQDKASDSDLEPTGSMPVSTVPEPATVFLLGFGLIAIGLIKRKMFRTRKPEDY